MVMYEQVLIKQVGMDKVITVKQAIITVIFTVHGDTYGDTCVDIFLLDIMTKLSYNHIII